MTDQIKKSSAISMNKILVKNEDILKNLQDFLKYYMLTQKSIQRNVGGYGNSSADSWLCLNNFFTVFWFFSNWTKNLILLKLLEGHSGWYILLAIFIHNKMNIHISIVLNMYHISIQYQNWSKVIKYFILVNFSTLHALLVKSLLKISVFTNYFGKYK